jgi:hypothetical protein
MSKQAWYRQPWLWLALAPMLLTMLAGVRLVFIAAEGADHAVEEDYIKRGKLLIEDTHRRDAARRLGLSATVRLQRVAGLAEVGLRAAAPLSQPLRLRLVHPTDARRDQLAPLQELAATGAERRYRAQLPQGIDGRWLLYLEAADGSWRLQGELAAGAHSLALDAES